MSEQPQPPTEAAFFTSIREWGLVRGTSGVLGGVVEGVGNKIGLARVPARLLTVIAWILLPGVVMLAYAAGWGLLPDARGNIIIQNFGRGVTNVGALIGIAILTLIGFFSFDSGPIFSLLRGGRNFYLLDEFPFGAFAVLIPIFFFLAFVTGIVVLVVWLVKRSNRNSADALAGSGANGTPAAGSPSAAGPSAAPHGAAPTSSTGTPQPWEPALLPGDPRAGVSASAGATKTPANAAFSAHSSHASAQASPTGTAPAGPATAPAAAAPPPPPARPAAPARPPAPTVPGPGQGGYLAFVAVLLISAAITVWLDRADMLAVSPLLAWGASITVGLGAILLIVALAGRKLGFLGFLSVFAVILAVLFSGNAEQIRDGYNNDWPWETVVSIEETFVAIEEDEPVADEDNEHEPVDLTTELGSQYSATFIAGSCVSPSEDAPWQDVQHTGDSTASMRLDTVDGDTTIDLAAWYTRLIVPEGTSIEVLGTGATSVVWEDRDASCRLWADGHEFDTTDEDGEYLDPVPQSLLSVTNPDAPVVTVNAGEDRSIYIQEVAK